MNDSDSLKEKATFPVYDKDGNISETVSVDIDTDRLSQTINKTKDRIQALQSRLEAFERQSTADFAAANAALPTPLTKREIEVVGLISLGATNREISMELKISQHTAKSHVSNIFNKIGVHDRAQVSAWGARYGLIDTVQ